MHQFGRFGVAYEDALSPHKLYRDLRNVPWMRFDDVYAHERQRAKPIGGQSGHASIKRVENDFGGLREGDCFPCLFEPLRRVPFAGNCSPFIFWVCDLPYP